MARLDPTQVDPIRLPAQCCGLAGIKGTYGLVSRNSAMPLSYSLDHVGPLTRTVKDSALILQAIAGHDPNDPTTSYREVPDYSDGIGDGVKRHADRRAGESLLRSGRGCRS